MNSRTFANPFRLPAWLWLLLLALAAALAGQGRSAAAQPAPTPAAAPTPPADPVLPTPLAIRNDQGFTLFAAPAGGFVIYVSSTRGSDRNSGFFADSPVRTLNKALALARPHEGDVILLRRGDQWNEDLVLTKSGRSPQQPLTMTSYGDEPLRPLLTGSMVIRGSHLALSGLHLQGPGKDLTPRSEGIHLPEDALARHILLEDLEIDGHRLGIQADQVHDLTLRRCLIHDNLHQGLYLSQSQRVLVEENLFDHNGVNPVLDHNIYKARGGSDLTFRGNILARAANYGLKIRALSHQVLVVDNLFLGNRNDLAVHVDRDDPGLWLNRKVRIESNLFLHTGARGQQNPIYVDHVQGLWIRDNIIAHARQTPFSAAIILGDRLPGSPINLRDLCISGNLVYHFAGQALRIQAAQFENVWITGNRFQQPANSSQFCTGIIALSNDALINVRELHLRDNTFQSDFPAESWFAWGSRQNLIGLEQWQQRTGARDNAAGHASPLSCSLGDYLNSAAMEPWRQVRPTAAPARNQVAGEAVIPAEAHLLLASAAARPPQFWDGRYRAAAVIAFFRNTLLPAPGDGGLAKKTP